MSLEQRARVLEIASSSLCGIRETTQKLKLKASNAIRLLKIMNEEQLIEIETGPPSKRGRPKKCITPTPLGNEFLETYNKLRMKPLKARKEDLARAAKDARYVDRLAERGLSPFQLFTELNVIVSNIENASKNH